MAEPLCRGLRTLQGVLSDGFCLKGDRELSKFRFYEVFLLQMFYLQVFFF